MLEISAPTIRIPKIHSFRMDTLCLYCESKVAAHPVALLGIAADLTKLLNWRAVLSALAASLFQSVSIDVGHGRAAGKSETERDR